MLRSLIISPDQEMAQRLESALATTGEVSNGRTLNRYPNAVDLARSLTAHAPEVVFLSFELVEWAQEVVKFLELEAPRVQIIAIHRNCDAGLLRETMRVGIREFLQYPFDRQSILDSLGQLETSVQSHSAVHQSTTDIFSFLPSKAGVGTSTLALNVSAAMKGNAVIGWGFFVYANATIGSAKYADTHLWVASSPQDTETVGLTYLRGNWDIGFFNKRIGQMYNDNGSTNQAVAIDPFNITNLFLNYTLKQASYFRGTKFRLGFNNLLDKHNIVGVAPASTTTSVPAPGDFLTLMAGRSISASVTFGYAPKR